jgi:hypothetical protein
VRLVQESGAGISEKREGELTMSNLILQVALGLTAMLAQEATKPAPLVPDLSWRPKAGDTANVYSKGLESIPCATEYLYYPEFDKLLRAKDNEGFEEMIAKGQVLFVKNGTDSGGPRQPVPGETSGP